MTSTTPRERMVQGAALLFRERGVTATGMREIAAHADAPRGSLQHYFPGGKSQIITEALAWISDQVTTPLHRAAAKPAPAREVVARTFDRWRRTLVDTDYLAGCPIVATVTDSMADPMAREAAAATFDAWQAALTTALHRGGLTTLRAERLAVLVMSSLEGAIVLARAKRSLEPLDVVAAELDRMITQLLRPTH